MIPLLTLTDFPTVDSQCVAFEFLARLTGRPRGQVEAAIEVFAGAAHRNNYVVMDSVLTEILRVLEARRLTPPRDVMLAVALKLAGVYHLLSAIEEFEVVFAAPPAPGLEDAWSRSGEARDEAIMVVDRLVTAILATWDPRTDGFHAEAAFTADVDSGERVFLIGWRRLLDGLVVAYRGFRGVVS